MQSPDQTKLSVSIQEAIQSFQSEAQQATGNISELLSLLRVLEDLHRHIRDDLFLGALPTNRQALYALLREIEQNGGWPYIPRMKIQEFIAITEDIPMETDAQ